MKILLRFRPTQGEYVRLPKDCLHTFQGFIYSLMSEQVAKFMHDEGYQVENKKYKLFAFSWPLAKKTVEGQYVVFKGDISLIISTPLSFLAQDILDEAVQREFCNLAGYQLFCTEIKPIVETVETEEITVRTLSPVCCFSTVYRISNEGQRPYVVYHSPDDPEFYTQIPDNITKKFMAMYPDQPVPEDKISVKPLGRLRYQKSFLRPDDPRPVKGWWGNFVLKGPKELLKIALDAGIGAKNSSGWGCVTLLKQK